MQRVTHRVVKNIGIPSWKQDEIFFLTQQGKSAKEIAETLGIGTTTVCSHRKRMGIERCNGFNY